MARPSGASVPNPRCVRVLQQREGDRRTPTVHRRPISIDAQGRLVGAGDLRAQATQVLENIRAILRANGAEMEDVVSVTVYVTDISAFHDIADIRLQYFPKDGPASAIVEVSNLALPELMIEIAAVAAVP